MLSILSLTSITSPLQAHPGALGCEPAAPDSALPYLLKVLSIAKALSVQAHPDKALAGRLHGSRPDMYKDANHKPELACALTPFEAMCGFRAPGDLAAQLAATPELRAMMGEATAAALTAAASRVAGAAAGSGEEGSGCSAGAGAGPGSADTASAASETQSAFKAALRAAFRAVMTQPANAVATHTAALAARLAAAGHSTAASASAAASSDSAPGPLPADAIAARLCGQFPGDVGVFAPFLLNTLRLAPGQAVFLAANEPHAYLAGDCVEVMACSDNVVRAGLTPKLKDVEVLVDMLTYGTGAPPVTEGEAAGDEVSAAGGKAVARTRQYAPPVPEFLLQRTEVAAPADAPAGLAYMLPAAPSAAILIVTEGAAAASVIPSAGAAAPEWKVDSDGNIVADAAAAATGPQSVRMGQVWLQPAGTAVTIHAEPGQRITLFRAHANPAHGR